MPVSWTWPAAVNSAPMGWRCGGLAAASTTHRRALVVTASIRFSARSVKTKARRRRCRTRLMMRMEILPARTASSRKPERYTASQTTLSHTTTVDTQLTYNTLGQVSSSLKTTTDGGLVTIDAAQGLQYGMDNELMKSVDVITTQGAGLNHTETVTTQNQTFNTLGQVTVLVRTTVDGLLTTQEAISGETYDARGQLTGSSDFLTSTAPADSAGNPALNEASQIDTTGMTYNTLGLLTDRCARQRRMIRRQTSRNR